VLATVPPPLALLRELLEQDRRDGMPWTPEDFAQRAVLGCRETRSRSWLRPIIETYPAWAASYRGTPSRLRAWEPRSPVG
jgi:hypothetical protein